MRLYFIFAQVDGLRSPPSSPCTEETMGDAGTMPAFEMSSTSGWRDCVGR